MSVKKALFPMLVCILLLVCACDYIVLPEEDALSLANDRGWSATATNIGKSDAGDLRIELTIQNNTGAWSTMRAVKTATLNAGGKATTCDTVFISSGDHRLAPGFRMRGYVAGTKAKPETQLIYVECKVASATGAEIVAGSKLNFDYTYFVGEYNYYYQEANKVDAKMEVNLDEVAADLTYPIGEAVDELIQKPADQITALNDCLLVLVDATRTDTGLQLKWQVSNPGEYPTYVHLGNPPVIGDDGILYGFYESPDLASVPIAPAGDKAEWTTEVTVPKETKGFYVMLSVESRKQRLFDYYAVDITDK